MPLNNNNDNQIIRRSNKTERSPAYKKLLYLQVSNVHERNVHTVALHYSEENAVWFTASSALHVDSSTAGNYCYLNKMIIRSIEIFV